MRIAQAMASAEEHERLLQSMQQLHGSLSRLLVALETLEARVARLTGPSLRVLRGGGQRAGFSPTATTFVAGNGSGRSESSVSSTVPR